MSVGSRTSGHSSAPCLVHVRLMERMGLHARHLTPCVKPGDVWCPTMPRGQALPRRPPAQTHFHTIL